MASWYGAARTNYFHSIDVEGLKKTLPPDVRAYSEQDDMVCLLAETDDGGWPSFFVDEQSDEETEFTFEDHVMPYVAEGEVVIAMSAGHEKLRYITGNAVAFIRRGDKVESVGLSIDRIYGMAAEEFGVPQNQITAAEY